MTPKRISKVLRELHELQAHALDLATPEGVAKPVSAASGSQSLQFMVLACSPTSRRS